MHINYNGHKIELNSDGYVKYLTINGVELEDFINNKIKDTDNELDFNDSMLSVIEKAKAERPEINWNYISNNKTDNQQEKIIRDLMLLSDQAKNLLAIIPKELVSMPLGQIERCVINYHHFFHRSKEALLFASSEDIDYQHKIMNEISDEKLLLFIEEISQYIENSLIASPSSYYSNRIIESIPHDKLNLFLPAITQAMTEAIKYPDDGSYEAIIRALSIQINKAMHLDSNYYKKIIKAIPESELYLFLPIISEIMKKDIFYCKDIIGLLPKEDSFYLPEGEFLPKSKKYFKQFIPVISEIMKEQMSNCLEILKTLPTTRIGKFAPVISEIMEKNPDNCQDIIKAMPEKKLDLLMPKISEIILTNSSHATSIIKSIPENQLDSFVTKFSQVMTKSEFCNPEIYSEAINSIPKEKTQLLLDNLSNIIISHIINGSGWIVDSPESWRNVKNILNALPQEHRIEMAINISNKINNTSRRDKILEIIPEEERELVNKKVTPTTWQAVRATAKAIAETAELVHGNSSIDTPKKKWQDKVSSKNKDNEQHKYV